MRYVLKNPISENTTIIAMEKKDNDACNHYVVCAHDKLMSVDVINCPCAQEMIDTDIEKLKVADIKFQNGPINVVGANGVQIEDLLRICIDRLKYFQSGNFACEENANALSHMRLALEQLDYRTIERESRNVEGSYNK